MRPLLPLLCALAACQSDRSFSSNTSTPDAPTGDALVELAPEALSWVGLRVGVTASKDLAVRSVGQANLVMYEARVIDPAGGVFYLPDEWLSARTVAPGDELILTLTATLSEPAAARGTLRIKSNDAVEPELLVELSATPAGDSGCDSGGDCG